MMWSFGTSMNRYLPAVFLLVLAACSSPASPEETVKRFHQKAASGDWDAALALVDMDAKAASMFAELYTSAGEQDKDRTRQILSERLKDVAARDIERNFPSGSGSVSIGKTLDNGVEVIQTNGKFSLIYLLEQRDGAWSIVDRTHETAGVRPSVKTGVESLLGKVEQDLGHKPSLKELNERLPSLLGRARVKRLKVGPGGGKP
jgi:hypothetical protein